MKSSRANSKIQTELNDDASLNCRALGETTPESEGH